MLPAIVFLMSIVSSHTSTFGRSIEHFEQSIKNIDTPFLCGLKFTFKAPSAAKGIPIFVL